jgi:hypothetical protein
MGVPKQTKLEKENQNFIDHVDHMMKQGRVPEYLRESVEGSIAARHGCIKLKDYWVQLYPTQGKKFLKIVPHKEILEELKMTEAAFFKIHPDKKIEISKTGNPFTKEHIQKLQSKV